MPMLDNRVLDHVDPDSVSTLRDAQGMQEAVLRRAAYLDDQDRMLLQLVLRGSISRREMGKLVGVPGGTVSRRVARLSRRLHDPIVVALTDPRCPLASEYRQLGVEHFLRGMSVRELADLHEMSPTQVREVLNFVRGWQKGISQRR
jgi:DNA-directed RNA polymerase specialized sigma24 family protein